MALTEGERRLSWVLEEAYFNTLGFVIGSLTMLLLSQ